jgi:capsular polysaccharide export protein
VTLSSVDFLNISSKVHSLFRKGANDNPWIQPRSKSSLELINLPVYQNALLLQGPVGPFFYKLAQFLKQRGTNTHKINFNPGDDWFYSTKEPNTFLYDFTLEYWPQYLERYIIQNQIEAIFLFGDCRPIHKPAKKLCQEYGVDLWVFEEGYYRPNYFTMEYFGVNANSSLYKKSIKPILSANKSADCSKSDEKLVHFSRSNTFLARHAIIYWIINILQPYKCSNYDHHRQLNFLLAYGWVKNFISHFFYNIKEHSILKELIDHQLKFKKNYFLFPLQVHDDAQMLFHCDFKSVEEVIELVLTSFYKHHTLHKDSPTKLIIKHHPMDLGHKNYSRLIKTLSRNLGISQHVYYLRKLDLNQILPYCKGCITVNSTLGLKALDFGVPVKVLGRSFYDKPYITSQKSLHQFWKHPGPVFPERIGVFRQMIIQETQVNGCLYSPEYLLK